MPHNWIVVNNSDDPEQLLADILAETDKFFDRDSVEVYWDVHTSRAYVFVDGPASQKELKALAWALQAIDVTTVLDATEALEAFGRLSAPES